jgi:hypothetical protein
LRTGISGDWEEEWEKGSSSPAGGIKEQVEDRSVRGGHENPSGGFPPCVWIIQARTESMIEVVELLVNVMGENCKKN